MMEKNSVMYLLEGEVFRDQQINKDKDVYIL